MAGRCWRWACGFPPLPRIRSSRAPWDWRVFLLLYLLDWVSAYSRSTVGQVMSYIALTTHFDNFSKGVIQLSDVVYYLSVMILGIFLTARSMEALKGRP